MSIANNPTQNMSRKRKSTRSLKRKIAQQREQLEQQQQYRTTLQDVVYVTHLPAVSLDILRERDAIYDGSWSKLLAGEGLLEKKGKCDLETQLLETPDTQIGSDAVLKSIKQMATYERKSNTDLGKVDEEVKMILGDLHPYR